MRLVRVDHQLLTESTLYVGVAHGTAVVAHIQTMVLQAVLTVVAQAAGPAGTHGDPIADSERTDRGPYPLDDAGNFVTENHRLTNTDGAEAAVAEVVQVRAADATATDANLQLIGPELGGEHLFDTQVARGMND